VVLQVCGFVIRAEEAWTGAHLLQLRWMSTRRAYSATLLSSSLWNMSSVVAGTYLMTRK
jgi:hypothetical protein